MKTYKKVIDDEMISYLERLSYELEGSKRIIKELISDNADNPAILETPTFEKYQQKYSEHNASYEIAKSEFQAKFINPAIIEAKELISWNLEYNTGLLTVNVGGPVTDKMSEAEIFAVPEVKEN